MPLDTKVFNQKYIPIAYIERIKYKDRSFLLICELKLKKKALPFFIFIHLEGCNIPFKVIYFNENKQDSYWMKLEEIAPYSKVEELLKKTVHINEDMVDYKDTKQKKIYQYIGYTLWNKDSNHFIGKVIAVIDNAYQSMLKVEKNQQHYLVPFHHSYRYQCNEKEQKLLIALPEGYENLILDEK